MANQGNKYIEIDKDILYQKYIIESKSMATISNELGFSCPTIHDRLKKYGLNRNKSEAQKIKCVREGVHNQFILDENLVKKLYLENSLSTYEIAEKLMCSQSKVYSTLKKIGVNKSISEVTKGSVPWNKNIPMCSKTKEKLKESLRGREGYWLGKIRNDDDKLKMRLSVIKRIKDTVLLNYQTFPNYNKNSIFYLEQYATENGYEIQHAENGGEFYIKELGYWVDGYDIDRNIVIEFDEKHHNKKKEIIKDMERQNKIITHLKCSFIRLDENGVEKLKINNHGK